MLDDITKNKESFIVISNEIIVKVSEGFIGLTGYSTDELLGKSYIEISRVLRFNHLNKPECTNKNFNIYMFTKLLEPREVIVSLERDENEKNAIYFFNEKENSRLESKFLYVEQLYLDNNFGIAIYSASDLVLLKANQKYIDYLDEPFNKKDNCIGKNIEKIVKGFKGSVAEEIWANTIKSGRTFRKGEVMYDRFDRGVTYWDTSIVPIYEDGKLKYLVQNCIEVTEKVLNKKLIEEQTNKIKMKNKKIETIIENVSDGIYITDLMEKEKIIIEKYKQLESLKEEVESANKIKSLFLANMSHEIRTPMNGILGTIQLLESTTIGMEQSKYITMLKESSNTLLSIINDILDISEIESGTYKLNNEQFSLREIVNNIYNYLLICGNSKGLEVSYYFDPAADCSVIGDERRLKQILNNLISNAIKFTQEGYISFRVTKIYSDNDCVKMKFAIRDTGIGIEESFKEKIFSAFNQGDISMNKKYMGAGLGLAISKQIVTLMNGNISFESTVGQGSTFFFTCEFKRAHNKSNNIDRNNIEEKNKTNNLVKNKVILYVEDNFIDQEIMESIVRRKCYKYIAANNGNEALNILKQNKVDLILLDVKMPELNGIETTKVIRDIERNGEHIPIIAMTAYAMAGDKDKCIKAGMDNYISKPFNIEELYNIFEFYLGE